MRNRCRGTGCQLDRGIRDTRDQADARQLPIIIPDDTILKQLSGTFIKAQCIKQNEFAGLIDDTIANKDLQVIQKDVDGIVNALYGI